MSTKQEKESKRKEGNIMLRLKGKIIMLEEDMLEE
jgi:hypothetical protein